MVSYFTELKRRNVLRVAAAYVVVAWVIVQAAVTLRELFPDTPIWIGQALLVFLFLGAVPVLTFSWFYELTPEGFKRDEEISGDRAYAEATGRKLIYLTLAFVFVGVALFSWSRIGQAPADNSVLQARAIDPYSVAVLPFVNMSADPDNEYFSDGLTETLLHMLAQVSDLKVAARTSSFAFKGKDMNIRDIALALGVANVLEGSVQRAGDRVRITAQLIRADDGFHVWSENYDRTLTDIFAIQDEIASRVGTALISTIVDDGRPVHPAGVATDSIEAYDLYLRARAERVKWSHGSLEEAVRLLQEALAIDPGFLDAKIDLGRIVYKQYQTGARQREEAFDDIVALMDQVLDVDPSNVPARFFLTAIALQRDTRLMDLSAWPEARPKLRKLVEESPGDVDLKVWLASFLSGYGGPDGRLEALEIMRTLAERDPLNAELHHEMAIALALVDNWDEAKRSIERSLELEPEAAMSLNTLALINMEMGDVVGLLDAWHEAMRVDPKDPEMPGAIAQVLYNLELIEQGDAYRDRTLTIAPNAPIARHLALAKAIAIGEIDEVSMLARGIFEDRVHRTGAWVVAGKYLMHRAISDGRIEETIAFIDRYMPGFADLEDTTLYQGASWLRFRFIHAFDEVYGREQTKALIERDAQHRRITGRSPGFENDPKLYIGILSLRGQTEEAINVALNEILSKSRWSMPGWREFFSEPHLAEVVADPRVAEALDRWAAEEAKARKDALEYLAERSP
jgi:TolB-like protein/tetratricopeptide (TPR) repeat protein